MRDAGPWTHGCGESSRLCVVGGGSAGSAIAAASARAAGIACCCWRPATDDRWIWLRVPLGAGRVLLSERSLWRFYTEPEAAHGQAQDVLAARAGARRLVDHQRHAVGARRAGRIRPLARRSATPAGATTTCCPFSSAARAYAQRRSGATRGRWAGQLVQFEPDELGAAFHRACRRPASRRRPTTTARNTRASASCRPTPSGACAMAAARPTSIQRAVARRWRCAPVRGPTASASRTGAPSASSIARARPATLRARPPGGDRLGRGGAEPASAGALRHRRPRATGDLRHRSGRPPAGRRRELPRPPAHPHFLRMHAPDHAERHSGQSAAPGLDGPALSACGATGQWRPARQRCMR